MVVPWRFRSTGCRFSEEDWDSLRTTIVYFLRHNPIGLEGPAVHGIEWENWLGDLLDAGGLGEKYWGSERGRGWIYPRDRDLIQPILRAQVVEMGAVERGKLKAVRPTGKLDSESMKGEPGLCAIPQKESDAAKQSGNMTDSNPVAPQRRGPGRPRKRPLGPEKHVAAEESIPSSAKRPRLPRGGEKAKGMRAGTKPGVDDSSISNAKDRNHNRDHPFAIKNLMFPATPALASANTGLVFETRLADTQKAKFIYATDTPSSSLFFRKVHEKFQLSTEQEIESVEVEIGTKVFVVDLEEERDWLAVIGAAEKSGDSAVSVVVGVT